MDESEACRIPGGLASVKNQFEQRESVSVQHQQQHQHTSVQVRLLQQYYYYYWPGSFTDILLFNVYLMPSPKPVHCAMDPGTAGEGLKEEEKKKRCLFIIPASDLLLPTPTTRLEQHCKVLLQAWLILAYMLYNLNSEVLFALLLKRNRRPPLIVQSSACVTILQYCWWIDVYSEAS